MRKLLAKNWYLQLFTIEFSLPWPWQNNMPLSNPLHTVVKDSVQIFVLGQLYICNHIALFIITRRLTRSVHRFYFHKGTVSRDFMLLVFFMNQFPPSPWLYHYGRFEFFFQHLRRYSQLKVCHRCRWHQWQMEKIVHQKIFYDFFWTPLGSRVTI